jgi:hypothetical protein
VHIVLVMVAQVVVVGHWPSMHSTAALKRERALADASSSHVVSHAVVEQAPRHVFKPAQPVPPDAVWHVLLTQLSPDVHCVESVHCTH